MKFNLNLSNISFLGEELDTISIHLYPIFIIEFINGYYTSKELFDENNNFLKNKKALRTNSIDNNNIKGDNSTKLLEGIKKEDNNEEKDIMSKSQIYFNKKEKFKSEDRSEQTNNINKRENERAINRDIEKNNKNKENTKSAPLRKSQICYNFIIYLGEYNEKIRYFNEEINKKKDLNKINYKQENCNDIIEIYKRKERINKIKLKKEYYKNKSEEIKKIKEKLQKIVSNKKNKLNNLKEKINSNKEYLSNLEKSNKESFSLLTQQKILYNSFLNKKMVEICFFFFNKKIKNLYLINDALKVDIKQDNDSIKKRFEYYNKNKKSISSMMGYITQLMIYMSKCFDIPLPYPLCLKGSKSFIIRGKKDKEKDYLPLHYDLKREDKYGNFETGLNYLKNDFKEIINFCLMFPQIISEDNYNKLFQDKESNMFFYFFVNFNHCLLEFVKNIQKMFE